MPLHVEGRYSFAAPIHRVWETLLDPAAISGCMPGRERFEQIGPDEFEVTLKVKIGPVSGEGTARVTLLDQQEPVRYRMRVHGGGGIGMIDGAGDIELAGSGGATMVTYRGDADVTGKVAAVGQRLLSASAKMMIGQFFKCMEGRLAAVEPRGAQ